jgi:hypothetical protein
LGSQQKASEEVASAPSVPSEPHKDDMPFPPATVISEHVGYLWTLELIAQLTQVWSAPSSGVGVALK